MTSQDGSIERVTVFLSPASSAALARAVEITGDSRTDTINRSIQTYSLMAGEVGNGGQVLIQSAGESAQPTRTQVWHVFEEDTGQPIPSLFTTEAAAVQGSIDRYQAAGEYSPDYSWRSHEDGAHELLAGGEPVGIYLTPVTVAGDPARLPTPDFFQPGRSYQRGRWTFHCCTVAPTPTTGLICALGYLTRTDGTCTVHALDQDNWEHDGWTEAADGEPGVRR